MSNKNHSKEYRQALYRFHYPDALKIKKKFKRIKVADRKYTEKLIENWHQFGYYIPPTETEIIHDIELDELVESDEYEYIDLNDCIEKENEDDEL